MRRDLSAGDERGEEGAGRDSIPRAAVGGLFFLCSLEGARRESPHVARALFARGLTPVYGACERVEVRALVPSPVPAGLTPRDCVVKI